MRTLKYIVEEQRLSKDPSCDFSNLVSGSSGYVNLEISAIGDSWSGCSKVVCFEAGGEKEFIGVVNGLCDIPSQFGKRKSYKISVYGVRKDGYEIHTNSIWIKQK